MTLRSHPAITFTMFAPTAVPLNAKVRSPKLDYGCALSQPRATLPISLSRSTDLVTETSTYRAGAKVADC